MDVKCWNSVRSKCYEYYPLLICKTCSKTNLERMCNLLISSAITCYFKSWCIMNPVFIYKTEWNIPSETV